MAANTETYYTKEKLKVTQSFNDVLDGSNDIVITFAARTGFIWRVLSLEGKSDKATSILKFYDGDGSTLKTQRTVAAAVFDRDFSSPNEFMGNGPVGTASEALIIKMDCTAAGYLCVRAIEVPVTTFTKT